MIGNFYLCGLLSCEYIKPFFIDISRMDTAHNPVIFSQIVSWNDLIHNDIWIGTYRKPFLISYHQLSARGSSISHGLNNSSRQIFIRFAPSLIGII